MELQKSNKISKFFKNRKTATFLVFLGFSSVIWLLIKLSHEYQQNYEVSISFYEKDKDKIISDQSNKTVTVLLKSTGFQLLRYNLFSKEFSINATDLGSNKVKINLGSNKYRNAIQNQLFKRSSVLSVSPENVTVTIDNLASKKVAVKPKVQLIFRNGYQLADSLSVDPAYITIYGPSELIDSTSYIATTYNSLEDVHENFKISADITPLDNKEITYSTNKVEISGMVERFSEKMYELPVRFINVPHGVSIKPFPEKIEVLCKGSLTDLKKITDTDFDLICDYNKIDSTSTFVKTEIKNKPSKIEVIKINDDNFQVLIRKK